MFVMRIGATGVVKVTWLEKGCDLAPSANILDRIANGMKMTSPSVSTYTY